MLTFDLIAVTGVIAAGWVFFTSHRQSGIFQVDQAVFLMGTLVSRMRVICRSAFRSAVQSLRGW